MSRRSARTKISFLSRKFQPQANQPTHEDRIPEALAIETLVPLTADSARYDALVAQSEDIVSRRKEIYTVQGAKTGVDLLDFPRSSAMNTLLSRLSKRASAKHGTKPAVTRKVARKSANLEQVLERAVTKLENADESEGDDDEVVKAPAARRRRIESDSGSDADVKDDADDDGDETNSKKEDGAESKTATGKQRTGDDELSDDVASLASSEMSETAGDYGLNYMDDEYSELDEADNDYAGDY